MLQPPRMLALALVASAVSVPLLASAPASASPCTPQPYTASASADLARISALNLGGLGLDSDPLANVTVAATASTMDARKAFAVKTSAAYLNVAGLNRSVSQVAPPVSAGPATATALSADLGLAHVGTGPLSARSTWQAAMGCGRQTGPAGTASASVADLGLLTLVNARQNLRSQAVTGLQTVGGHTASVAAAEIELADLSLLSGAVDVTVVKPPTLKVTSTGVAKTSSVAYQAPILDVSGPGVGRKRISSPGQQLELALPIPGLLNTVTGAAKLPLLAGNPLESLLGSLPAAGTPALGILRLTIGAGTKSIADGGVSASAASLRIELLVGGPGGKQISVLDLGLGVLTAAAGAPCPESATPPPPPPSPHCGGPHCPAGLPVTGMPPVAYVSAAGLLVLILGRFLMLLARRRSTA